MNEEHSHIADDALALTYVVTALVLIAVYREPLYALAKDVGAWMSRCKPRATTVRHLGGRLWADVNKAIDDAGR